MTPCSADHCSLIHRSSGWAHALLRRSSGRGRTTRSLLAEAADAASEATTVESRPQMRADMRADAREARERRESISAMSSRATAHVPARAAASIHDATSLIGPSSFSGSAALNATAPSSIFFGFAPPPSVERARPATQGSGLPSAGGPGGGWPSGGRAGGGSLSSRRSTAPPSTRLAAQTARGAGERPRVERLSLERLPALSRSGTPRGAAFTPRVASGAQAARQRAGVPRAVIAPGVLESATPDRFSTRHTDLLGLDSGLARQIMRLQAFREVRSAHEMAPLVDEVPAGDWGAVGAPSPVLEPRPPTTQSNWSGSGSSPCDSRPGTVMDSPR